MEGFAQASKVQAHDEFGELVLGTIMEESPIINEFDKYKAFEPAPTEFEFRPATDVANIQARDRNGSYTRTAIAPQERIPGAQFMLGDAILVDETDKRDIDRGFIDLNDHFKRRYTERLRSFGKGLDAKLANGSGTGTPAELKGILTILDGINDIPGYSGVKGVVDAATLLPAGDSLDLSNKDNWDAFLEAIPIWLALVPDCKGMWMNQHLAARITTMARKSTILNYGVSKDEFNNEVETLNRVPIRIMKDTSFTNTEVDNNATNNTTSILFANPGQGKFSVKTNGSISCKAYDPDDLQSVGWSFEFSGAISIENRRAVLRARNIKL